MDSYKKLLLANRAWVQEKTLLKPEYFKNLARDQQPEFLWIGCSDSRVPAEEITGTQPGEIFVHRNIANLVVHTDFNLLSVLQYAVDFLKVKHVIVCGHYGCGGVRAALSDQSFGLLNHWLRHIKDICNQNIRQITDLADPEDKLNQLVELNVLAQVRNLARTEVIQRAWAQHQRPIIHGWVYGLSDGILKPLFTMSPGAEIDQIYRFRLEPGSTP